MCFLFAESSHSKIYNVYTKEFKEFAVLFEIIHHPIKIKIIELERNFDE